MAIPALAYPVTATASDAVVPNTTSRRSPWLTGMFTLSLPVHVWPMVKIGFNVGDKLNDEISVKMFEVADCDLNTRTRIVGALNKVAPNATLKNPEISVIVPSRGTTEAKFNKVPAAPVKSTVVPERTIFATDEPIPMAADVPSNPPTRPVMATGVPDA